MMIMTVITGITLLIRCISVARLNERRIAAAPENVPSSATKTDPPTLLVGRFVVGLRRSLETAPERPNTKAPDC